MRLSSPKGIFNNNLQHWHINKLLVVIKCNFQPLDVNQNQKLKEWGEWMKKKRLQIVEARSVEVYFRVTGIVEGGPQWGGPDRLRTQSTSFYSAPTGSFMMDNRHRSAPLWGCFSQGLIRLTAPSKHSPALCSFTSCSLLTPQNQLQLCTLNLWIIMPNI